MCGIGGIFSRRAQSDDLRKSLAAMAAAMRHRGPDDNAVWLADATIGGFAHTRLAIVDTTPTGAQPMHSDDGRFVLVFNGEIYNDRDLRQELLREGHRFRGTSDTEVLLALLVREGRKALDRVDGMFGFALYDRREQTLFCARDPLGEKPFYFVAKPDLFAFASEVRALLASSVVSRTPSPLAFAHLLRNGSIPAPLTHVEEVKALEAGSLLHVDLRSYAVVKERYWSLPFRAERDRVDDREAAETRVLATLRQAVRLRARADVPVASFLSGGVDSSLVSALLVEAVGNGLNTFTITVPGNTELDEGTIARSLAQRLGTRHHEVPIELDDRGDWLDAAFAAMDVPSVDGINTWLVAAAAARGGFKVACTGLGGDELFLGYSTFRAAPRDARFLSPFAPLRPIHRLTSRLAAYAPATPRAGRVLDAALAGGGIPVSWLARRAIFSTHDVGRLLGTDAAIAAADQAIERARAIAPAELPSARRVSALELSIYMHDQLLRDTDVMSMAHSLEVRVPLIARPVVEMVASLSTASLGPPAEKQLLRSVLRKCAPHIPMAALKRGFALDWPRLLRRDLLIDQSSRSILKSGVVAAERAAFMQGRRHFARTLVLESASHALRSLGC